MIEEGSFIHVAYHAMAVIFAVPTAVALSLLVVGSLVDLTVAVLASLRRR